MAKTYAIYEAKAKLSELLRAVKRGRPVTISERGEPIAVITPLKRTPDISSRLAELEGAGVVHPASASLGAIHPLRRKPGALRRFLGSRE